MPRSSSGVSSDGPFLFGRRARFQLNDLMCRQAGPGRHPDGACLYLYVRPSGSRSWVLRLTILGNRYDLGLGPYPPVSLSRARELAAEYRSIARQGGDPRKARKTSSAPTVREAAEFVIKDLKRSWTAPLAENRYRRGLERMVFPTLGPKRIDEITVDDCYALVDPLWHGRGSSGFRLRHQLVHLMTWAVNHGHRNDNPAELVLGRLPKVRSRMQHQPSLPYRQVGAALSALQATEFPPVFKLVIRFLVLTAVRLREATEARWSEFDLEAATWTIPGSRMKKRIQHRVPLSKQVLEILADAREHDPTGVLVFGFRNGRRRPRALNSADIANVLHALELKDDEDRNVVAHGFRATFTDWVADNEEASVEAAEAALAHAPESDTRKAYQRKDLLNARIPLMQKWADYVLPRTRS